MMTINEIINANHLLTRNIETDDPDIKNTKAIIDRMLPIKMSYAIAKTAKVLAEEVSVIEQQRIKLLEANAEKNDDGTPKIEGNAYILADQSKFVEEYTEYLNSESDIKISKFPESEIDKLDDPRYDALSASELAGLEFMIGDN